MDFEDALPRLAGTGADFAVLWGRALLGSDFLLRDGLFDGLLRSPLLGFGMIQPIAPAFAAGKPRLFPFDSRGIQ
ncbi:MAG: hypothetical protein EBY32_20765 [Proteobacteria bacterium]|nr:hypothetical protein [Pseudomonadota bacterium]